MGVNMAGFFQSLKNGYSSLTGSGQFLMLFMVSLLLLWLVKEFAKKEFRRFATIMLLLLLCPFSVKLLLLYQTPFYGYENLWALLPMTVVLACAAVVAVSKISSWYITERGRLRKAVSGRRERVYEALAAAVFALLLFFCGTMTSAKGLTEQDYDGDKLPKEAAEVFALLEISEGEDVFLLAPDDLAAWARIYSGHILLPYGRNLWEPELSAYTYDVYKGDMEELHNWVNGTLMTGSQGEEALREEEMLLSYCASAGYDYLVFSWERGNGENLRSAMANQNEYTYFAQTDAYVIYRLL